MNRTYRELERWIGLMQQIVEAKYYISRAEEIGCPAQFRSLDGIFEFFVYFRSALNCYAKCFVSSGAGRMRLDAKEVFSARPDMRDWHTRIIDLRHKYVAHSDDNELEKISLECSETDTELVVRLQHHFCFPFDRLYELRDLIRFVDGYVVDRQKMHVASIERRIGKSVRIAEGEQAVAADRPKTGAG